MRVRCNFAVSAIMWRRAAAILLLSAITSRPAAAQPFDRDPHTEALRLSSRGVPAPSREWPIPTNLMVPDGRPTARDIHVPSVSHVPPAVRSSR